ncbi:adenosylcobinamide-GDP ribazoletransferase [Microlunatus capsulatus]|uniref:Adenosylcobinamide-GDP ribazoletransferase n=1 Tax=Microlunatus capsulatus TaxID=99117 RepID=A0ABS4Z7W8_9ACTN|nr:adenosylcobinamide-GDP ribazoletransferase [Microlunatus capsulatus]MBP2417146.1 adenosylcobinamide-GDP ribazoletransferase [Microlunatus capsulatus]
MPLPLGPALRLAVGTLTVLPTGAVTVDRATARGAMLLAPLAVVPLALAAALVTGVAAALDLPATAVGLLGVAVLALGTRALHLDGLADTVDGLGTGWDRARALDVMRRGDVGPMGVVALVLVLGLQAVAAGALVDGWADALGLAVLVCASRAALVVVCRAGVPAARPSGLGAAVAGTVPTALAAAVWVVVAALLALTWVLRGGAPLGGLLTAALALAAAALLVTWCRRRLGGVTGDVMGAVVEVTLTVLLLGATATGGWTA